MSLTCARCSAILNSALQNDDLFSVLATFTQNIRTLSFREKTLAIQNFHNKTRKHTKCDYAKFLLDLAVWDDVTILRKAQIRKKKNFTLSTLIHQTKNALSHISLRTNSNTTMSINRSEIDTKDSCSGSLGKTFQSNSIEKNGEKIEKYIPKDKTGQEKEMKRKDNEISANFTTNHSKNSIQSGYQQFNFKKIIFVPIYSISDNSLINSKTALYKFIKPKHLDLPCDLNYDDHIIKLQTLRDTNSPIKKLSILVSIFDAIQNERDSIESILSTFIYVLLRAQITDALVECELIKLFQRGIRSCTKSCTHFYALDVKKYETTQNSGGKNEINNFDERKISQKHPKNSSRNFTKDILDEKSINEEGNSRSKEGKNQNDEIKEKLSLPEPIEKPLKTDRNAEKVQNNPPCLCLSPISSETLSYLLAVFDSALYFIKTMEFGSLRMEKAEYDLFMSAATDDPNEKNLKNED